MHTRNLLKTGALAVLLAVSPGWALGEPARDWAVDITAHNISLPLTADSAAALAQLHVSSGTVLSVDEDRRNAYTVYLVKVLHENGRVRVYGFDRDTGQPLRNQ